MSVRTIVAMLIGLLVAACWLPILQAPYFWDDQGTILDNAFLDAPWSVFLAESLRPHLGHWQPAAWWTLRLDDVLFGPLLDAVGEPVLGAAFGGTRGAAAPHLLGNLLLHAVTAAALYTTLWRMLLPSDPEEGALGVVRGLAAGFVALLFALHPCRVESVAWTTERRDVLAALLIVLGLAAWLRDSRRGRAWAFALFAASALAKAWVVALPVALLGVEIGVGGALGHAEGPRAGLRLALRRVAPSLLIAVPTGAMAAYAQHAAGATADAAGLSLLERLVGAGVALWRYFGLTLWPAELSPLHPIVPGRTLTPTAILLALAAAGLLGWLAWRALSPLWNPTTPRSRRDEELFGAVLAAVGWLAPVLGLLQSGVQAIAERYLLLPHLALALPLAGWLTGWLQRGTVVLPDAQGDDGNTRAVVATRFVPGWRLLAGMVLLPMVIVPLLIRLFLWQGVWIEGGEALWTAAIAAESASPHAHANRAALRMAIGDEAGAAADLDAALTLSPRFANALEQRAGLHERHGDLAAARADLDAAVAAAPDDPKVRCNRGAVLARAGDRAAATADFDHALAAGAGPDCALNRAVLRFRSGDREGAAADVRDALARLPRAHPLRPRAEGMARALGI